MKTTVSQAVQHGARAMRIALVLNVVETLGVGLPDFDLRIRHRRTIKSRDAPGHEARLAARAVGDIVAVAVDWRTVNEERTEDRRFGAARGLDDSPLR